MKEITGDLWADRGQDAICLTTNGYVKAKDSTAVMGRGCAAQAKSRFPTIASDLGSLIRTNGNVTQLIHRYQFGDIISYPVKAVSEPYDGTNCVEHMVGKFSIGATVPGWALKADLDLIIQSAKQLVALANAKDYRIVVVPRPGCGAGELTWEVVKAAIENILDDRFFIITFPTK